MVVLICLWSDTPVLAVEVFNSIYGCINIYGLTIILKLEFYKPIYGDINVYGLIPLTKYCNSKSLSILLLMSVV